MFIKAITYSMCEMTSYHNVLITPMPLIHQNTKQIIKFDCQGFGVKHSMYKYDGINHKIKFKKNGYQWKVQYWIVYQMKHQKINFYVQLCKYLTLNSHILYDPAKKHWNNSHGPITRNPCNIQNNRLVFIPTWCT